MQIKTKIFFDSGTPDFTFSLCRQDYIIRDGNEVPVGRPTRLGVVPGDIDKVIRFVKTAETPENEETIVPMSTNTDEHPIVQVLNELWSDEVINGFRDNRPKPPHQNPIEEEDENG